MYFPSDTTTEIIAHFMGYFELAVEAARQRHHYAQIRDAEKPAPIDPDPQPVSIDIAQNYAMGAFQPGVGYTPPSWIIRGDAPVETLPWHLFFPRVPHVPLGHEDVRHPHQAAAAHGFKTIAPEPGSVIALFEQTIALNDDDLLVLGEYGGPLHFSSGADVGILTLYDEAMKIAAPVAGLGPLHGLGDVAHIVADIARFGAELGDAGPSEDMDVSLRALDGSFINGEAVDETPKLIDHLPPHWHDTLGMKAPDAESEETVPVQHVSLAGDTLDTSVTLNAGGNLLANEANFLEAGLTSSVFAVRGDVHQLDVIIQINAYYDTDSFADGFLGGLEPSLSSTSTYNIANFVAETRDVPGAAAAANPGLLPTSWNVTVVNGDLVFVEWLKQFNFASDQDMSVLSATGSTTFATTGENAAVNATRFADLGFYYDLVIVGGRLYDANIISQTNILYDNDTIEMLAGDMTGKINTSGNLLWNQATINNIGPTQFTQGLPDHYIEAMKNLDAGNDAMPSGFLSGKEFAGFGALKVLYVSGNLFDLRYVEQSNILGDADFVAVQKAKALSGLETNKWTIDTGSNSLVNMAHIRDFDSLGKTAFAGGNVYSDAVLIQGDLIGHGNPNQHGALVNEVVAFLDTDKGFLASHFDDIGPFSHVLDGPAADIMQSVLA